MRNVVRNVVGLTLGLLVIGCGGSSGTNALPDPNLRFINVAPDVSLNLDADEDNLFSNLSFLAGTSQFVKIKNELKDFVMTENGSTVAIDSQTTTLAKDTDHLFVAFGKKDFGAETEKRLRFSPFQVNRRTPNGTKARVYGFNGFVRSVGEQNFGVVFKNPGTISTINFAPVAFGEITSQEIDAGPQTLVAQRQFTETEFATVTKNFEPGKIYFMVFSGVEGTTGATTPAISFIELQKRD
jgi:hypothetical protein